MVLEVSIACSEVKQNFTITGSCVVELAARRKGHTVHLSITSSDLL